MARKGRGLRPDELDLWNKVARQTVPMHPKAPDRTPTPPAKTPAPKPLAEGRDVSLPTFRIGETSTSKTPGHNLSPSVSDRVNSAPVAMDRKAFNRMKRGKLPVDARIDLHGMTLAQAHPKLNSFILSAQARGDRLVHVITGKGKSKPFDGPIPMRTGALKHEVPMWLRSPALRSAVLQVSEAHLKHGGGGAYYVYLRRSR